MSECDVTVDFMDMTDDGRLQATPEDVRRDLRFAVGKHVTVGDEDADSAVGRIVSIDDDGNLEIAVVSLESVAERGAVPTR